MTSCLHRQPADGGDVNSIRDLMLELDGADAETVNRVAWEKGSLPVRLAMLGLAAVRKGTSSLWFGYPPGVFVSYKWGGQSTRDLVMALAEHVRGLGYRPFLDLENLDEDADGYFQVPAFITFAAGVHLLRAAPDGTFGRSDDRPAGKDVMDPRRVPARDPTGERWSARAGTGPS